MTRRKTAVLCLAALLAGTMSFLAAVQQEQQTLSQKLVRLHVVANSDGEVDQALKLQVRDAVLEVTEPLVQQAEDPFRTLQQSLPMIQKAARRCLLEHGSMDPVQVTMGQERFPTRYYDSFALPAGVYTSLRVTIGDGTGKNWWCVAFPSLCLRAASDLEEAAAAAGFTEEEIGLITGEENGYIFKFRILELLEQLKEAIFE